MVPAILALLKPPLTVCMQLNPEARQALPKLAFNGFAARFKEPITKEGFQDVTQLDFRFRGTKEEYDTWARYWL